MVVFSKLQQGNEWTDSDEVRDKTRRGADEHDRAPALMDFFFLRPLKRETVIRSKELQQRASVEGSRQRHSHHRSQAFK